MRMERVTMNTLYEQIKELERTISALEEARDSAEEAAELLQGAGLLQLAETVSDFAQEIDCEMDPFVRELSELYAREREEVYWDNQRDL